MPTSAADAGLVVRTGLCTVWLLMVIVQGQGAATWAGAVGLETDTQEDPHIPNGRVASALLDGDVTPEVIYPERTSATGHPMPINQHYLSNSARYPQHPARIFYRLPLAEHILHVHLEPNPDILAPGLSVQYMDGDRTWLDTPSAEAHCFYTGGARGEAKSIAVLSLCHGLRGVVDYGGVRYVIVPQQPTNNHTSTQHGRHGTRTLGKPHHVWKYNITGGRTGALSPPLPSSYRTTYNYRRHPLPRRRRKRSLPWESYVQTMVVADHTMANYHQDDLQHYIVTLMAVVASIYRDDTIRNTINVMLTKLIILKNKEDGPEISSNAVTSLSNFCKWQRKFNKANDSANQHDTAILLTRINICRSNSACDTLGLAEIGTICDPDKSCAIIEENGLSAAFTMAHELGHLFNLPHDDHDRCAERYSKPQMHVMGPVLNHNSVPWSWSHCSADILSEFLEQNLGHCLLDRPSSEVELKKFNRMLHMLPGEEYPADRQCQMIYGPNSIVCPYMSSVCEILWCTSESGLSGGCRTRRLPWSDGTTCGDKRWCQKGVCVAQTEISPVDGGWGRWGEYGPCSRTCGGGVTRSYRECDTPTPRYRGKFCLGHRVRYKSCNTETCPGDPDDRDYQCAKFDGRSFNSNTLPHDVHWIPKYTGITGRDQCKLYCQVAEGGFYYEFSQKVVDGTKCNPFTNDICVNGRCQPAGCDNLLGSDLEYDDCGVCGGDTSSCVTVTGKYNPRRIHYGYNYVTTIPKYASKIDVRQYGYNPSGPDDNYLALMSSGMKRYILNGEYIITINQKDIKIGSSMIEYSGSNVQVERVNGTRMIKEDLIVLVLSVKHLRRPNIEFSYTKSLGENVKFEWETNGEWSECSSECRGKRHKIVRCLRLIDRKEFPANKCDQNHIPATLSERCNTECRFTWYVRSQSTCSSWCGPGTMKREVVCIRQTTQQAEVVAHKFCQTTGVEPPVEVNCTGSCGVWKYGPWSGCSKACERGIMVREAWCSSKDNGVKLAETACDPTLRQTSDYCNERPCTQWAVSNWTQCSATCDQGSRQRLVVCSSDLGEENPESFCDHLPKPSITEECVLAPCPRQWEHAAWTPHCSVTCGAGVVTRGVRCVTSDGAVIAASLCDQTSRPLDFKPCVMPPCFRVATFTQAEEVTHPYSLTIEQKSSVSPTSGTTLTPTLAPTSVPVSTTSTTTAIQTTVAPTTQQPSTAASSVASTTTYAQSPSTDNIMIEESTNLSGAGKLNVESRKLSSDKLTEEWGTPSSDNKENEVPSTTSVVSNAIDESPNSISQWYPDPHEPRTRDKEISNYVPEPPEKPIRIDTNTIMDTLFPRELPSNASNSESNHNRGHDNVIPLAVSQPNRNINHIIVDNQTPSKNSLLSSSVSLVTTVANGEADSNTIATTVTVATTTAVGDYGVWRTGRWTACSASCGVGLRDRYVSCTNILGLSVSNQLCPHDSKPHAQEECMVKPCSVWRNGDWGQCTRTCGGGLQRRYVACILLDEQLSFSRDCSRSIRPVAEQQCNTHTCINVRQFDVAHITNNDVEGTSFWRVGPWGACSKSCGSGGVKMRAVVCQDERGPSERCNENHRPTNASTCDNGQCPVWNYGRWGPCSASCGTGYQSRMVHCQSRDHVHDDGSCDVTIRPTDKRACNLTSCPPRTYWTRSEWSPCSVTCGRGWRSRNVTCTDNVGNVYLEEVCTGRAPVQRKKCKASKCPHWFPLEWSECSATCGTGVRTRLFQCKIGRAEVDMSLCNHLRKPRTKERCKTQLCLRYRWRSGSWSECSESCGTNSIKHRLVRCHNSTGHGYVSDSYCHQSSKPRSRKRCLQEPCPYIWYSEPWSECSRTCGRGHQERRASCRRISPEGWMLNPVNDINCLPRDRPTTERPCNQGDCSHGFRWQTSGWGDCSAACGQGWVSRSVFCVEQLTNQKRSGRHCDHRHKPDMTQNCYVGPCYARSCRQLRILTGLRTDGDYRLKLNNDNHLAHIYCKNMRRSHPTEYVSLTGGADENYAEVYGRKLLNASTCPYGGARNDSCTCAEQRYSKGGYTGFGKIRLNITSLTVIADDFTFTSTRGGRPVAYGTAGDCYSTADCPQGRFRINLSGTSFAVSRITRWRSGGRHASSQIVAADSSDQVIGGRCGGYCGHCIPDPVLGLKLTIVANNTVAGSLAEGIT